MVVPRAVVLGWPRRSTVALAGAVAGSTAPPAAAEEVVLEAMCGLSSHRRQQPTPMPSALSVLGARPALEVLRAATVVQGWSW